MMIGVVDADGVETAIVEEETSISIADEIVTCSTRILVRWLNVEHVAAQLRRVQLLTGTVESIDQQVIDEEFSTLTQLKDSGHGQGS
jgi:hypothetical protein